MDPSVVRLIAAAQLVRDSAERSDEMWTAAHEVLYDILAEVEAHLATLAASEPPAPAPSTARRRAHWTIDLTSAQAPLASAP